MNQNTVNNYLDYYCIIGAGASGIATVIQFNKNKIKYKIFEKQNAAGGIWQTNTLTSYSYKGLTTNTSKICTYIQGYPHDKSVSYYMSFDYISEYLKKILEKECNKQDIYYGIEIKEITNINNTYWMIKDQNNIVYNFKGIIVCAGNEAIPDYHILENANQIKQIHSSEYTGLELIKGKNIVVVGSGQSAIDIIEHGLTHANKIIHCTRKIPGWKISEEKSIKRVKKELLVYDFINKFPDDMTKLDKLLYFFLKIIFKTFRKLMPLGFLKLSLSRKIKVSAAKLNLNNWSKNFSLKIFPVSKEFLTNYINSEKISTKRDISRIDKKHVIFSDGSVSENIDLIIYATGYKQEFNFLKNKDTIFHDKHNAVEGLYFGFLSKKKDIFFVGHIYPLGPHWVLYEMQASLVASCIKSSLSQGQLLNVFKRDTNVLTYTVYNHGNSFSRYIDINRYLRKGYKYLCIINKT